MLQFIFSLTVLFGPSAQADQLLKPQELPVLGGLLQVESLGHSYEFEVIGADVTVETMRNRITLNIQRTIHCPEGMACIALAPAPIVVELPIVYIETNTCGSTKYWAIQDKTFADGLRETIVVEDESTNICPAFHFLPATRVRYSSYNPWTGKTEESSYVGEKLQVLPSTF